MSQFIKKVNAIDGVRMREIERVHIIDKLNKRDVSGGLILVIESGSTSFDTSLTNHQWWFHDWNNEHCNRSAMCICNCWVCWMFNHFHIHIHALGKRTDSKKRKTHKIICKLKLPYQRWNIKLICIDRFVEFLVRIRFCILIIVFFEFRSFASRASFCFDHCVSPIDTATTWSWSCVICVPLSYFLRICEDIVPQLPY